MAILQEQSTRTQLSNYKQFMNTIKVTIKDHLSIITLDRGKSNAMNGEMIAELDDMLKNIAGDPNISGAIITG